MLPPTREQHKGRYVTLNTGTTNQPDTPPFFDPSNTRFGYDSQPVASEESFQSSLQIALIPGSLHANTDRHSDNRSSGKSQRDWKT